MEREDVSKEGPCQLRSQGPQEEKPGSGTARGDQAEESVQEIKPPLLSGHH